MKIRELTLQELRMTYKEHLFFDFPADERKQLDMIEKLIADNRYQCFGMFNMDKLVGYAFFAFDGDIYLLDYFAVVPELRGKGLGTSFFKEVVSHLKAKIVILEIEDSEKTNTASDAEKCVRRQAFYCNAGCIDTHVKTKCFGVNYLLLEYPLINVHNEHDVANAYVKIYQAVLPKDVYEENVEVLSGNA